jgi:DNA primase
MKVRGVSFRHAVELLRTDLSIAATVSNAASTAAPAKHSTVRALPAPVSLDADDQRLLGQVLDYYHATLKNSPEALAYLKTRGIDSAAAIDSFRLGYANRTLGLRLPSKTRRQGEAIRARLEKLGIYRASGHEHFNGSLIVPVFDGSGHVVEVYCQRRSDLGVFRTV